MKIIAKKNGPLVLIGLDVLYTQNMETLSLDEETEICRCGQSFNMPFCDGNHIIFEFEDVKDPYRTPDALKKYPGKNITIYDNRGVCSHRGICFEDLPNVFQMNTQTFIDPDAASVEEIIDICERCPSGALSYALPSGDRVLEGEKGNWLVRLAPKRHGYDGPLEVRGSVPFEDERGSKPESPSHYALCRCGQSKNMPFCSGDHWRVHFIDESNDEDAL